MGMVVTHTLSFDTEKKISILLPSSGLLSGVRWFKTDVSGEEEGLRGLFDP